MEDISRKRKSVNMFRRLSIKLGIHKDNQTSSTSATPAESSDGPISRPSRRASIRQSIGRAMDKLRGSNSSNHEHGGGTLSSSGSDESVSNSVTTNNIQTVTKSLQLYDKGVQLIEENQFAEAVKVLDKVITREPTFGPAYSQRASAKMKLKEYDAAVLDLEKAIEASVDLPDVNLWKQKALANTILRRYDSAVQDCDKAIELSTDIKAVDLVLSRSQLLIKLGRIDEALEYYDSRVMSMDSENVNFLHGRAVLLKEANRNADTMIVLNKILDIDPAHPDGWITKGVIYERMGKMEAAVECYTSLIQISSDVNPDVLYYRSGAYFKLSQYDRALQDVNEAISSKADTPDYYNLRGMVMCELERFEDAINDYSQVLQLGSSSANNNVADVLYNRARCYSFLEKNTEAYEDAKRACELDPSKEIYQEFKEQFESECISNEL